MWDDLPLGELTITLQGFSREPLASAKPPSKIFGDGYAGGLDRCACIHFGEPAGELRLGAFLGPSKRHITGAALACDRIGVAGLLFEAPARRAAFRYIAARHLSGPLLLLCPRAGRRHTNARRARVAWSCFRWSAGGGRTDAGPWTLASAQRRPRVCIVAATRSTR